MMIDDRLVNSLTENRHHRAANLKVVLTPPSPLKYIFSLTPVGVEKLTLIP